jgi:hypothetical protein
MPYIRRHKRSGRRHTVRAHRRNPPWVNTAVFIILVIVVAAIAAKTGAGK